MLLGCIGDDFTGSGDLANTLARAGMRAELFNGVPDGDAGTGAEAGIVALKTRTMPVAQAVAESLAALDWLLAQGCRKFFFKYCSTFDSTPEGNIGPVAEALAERLDADRIVVCPAFPGTGRTLFQGHLFVGDRLLSDSGMALHPLTPMTDPDIRRWLSRQATLPVHHVALADVARGADAIRAEINRKGRGFHVIDAVSDADLLQIGTACAGLPLVTGGSGVAMGLPTTLLDGARSDAAADWTGAEGPGVILAGSCSEATRAQVAEYVAAHPALKLDPEAILTGAQTAAEVRDWCLEQTDSPLVYATDTPEAVAALQDRLGKVRVAEAVEGLLADLAGQLAGAGVRRIVAAGGETSGAVVKGLGSQRLRIGPEIAPGVPAMQDPDQGIAVALKSGNFGGAGFFEKALRVLGGADV